MLENWRKRVSLSPTQSYFMKTIYSKLSCRLKSRMIPNTQVNTSSLIHLTFIGTHACETTNKITRLNSHTGKTWLLSKTVIIESKLFHRKTWSGASNSGGNKIYTENSNFPTKRTLQNKSYPLYLVLIGMQKKQILSWLGRQTSHCLMNQCQPILEYPTQRALWMDPEYELLVGHCPGSYQEPFIQKHTESNARTFYFLTPLGFNTLFVPTICLNPHTRVFFFFYLNKTEK